MNNGKDFLSSFIGRFLPGSDFIKNASTLAGGTGIAQFIPFLILPLLSRLYSPAEFGWFGVYTAIAMVISVFVTGRYELAILLPGSNREANHLIRLAEILCVSAGFSVLIIVLLFHNPIATLFSVEPIAYMLMILPVSIISMALIQVYSYRQNRAKNYTAIAGGKITYSIILAAGQVIPGIYGYTGTGLIFGFVFATSVHALTLRLWHPSIFRDGKPIDFQLIKEIGRRYLDFPKHNAPHAVTNALSGHLPVILLNRFISESVAGLYTMAFRIVQAPVMLISASIGQVFSQTISEMHRNGENLYAFTIKLYKLLFLISLIPFIILGIWGSEIFIFVLGEEWAEAGRYAQIFSPAFFLVFIVAPTVYITALLNQQKKAFIYEAIFVFVRVGALSIGIYLKDPIIAVAGYSAGTIVMMLFYVQWFLKLAKGSTN